MQPEQARLQRCRGWWVDEITQQLTNSRCRVIDEARATVSCLDAVQLDGRRGWESFNTPRSKWPWFQGFCMTGNSLVRLPPTHVVFVIVSIEIILCRLLVPACFEQDHTWISCPQNSTGLFTVVDQVTRISPDCSLYCTPPVSRGSASCSPTIQTFWSSSSSNST